MSESDERDLYFDCLKEQIDPNKNAPEEETKEEEEDEKTDDDQNSSRESWNMFISPQEYLRQQAEEELRQEKEPQDNIKVKHPDEVFSSLEDQMKNIKLKVAVEYFHELRKTEKNITAKQLSRWLYEYADEYGVLLNILSSIFLT